MHIIHQLKLKQKCKYMEHLKPEFNLQCWHWLPLYLSLHMHVPLRWQPVDPFTLHLQSVIDKKENLLTTLPTNNCHKEIVSYFLYILLIQNCLDFQSFTGLPLTYLWDFNANCINTFLLVLKYFTCKVLQNI